MNKPTYEEYERAKDAKSYIQSSLRLCKSKQNSLVADLRENYKQIERYNELFKQAEMTIKLYESYEEVESRFL